MWPLAYWIPPTKTLVFFGWGLWCVCNKASLVCVCAYLVSTTATAGGIACVPESKHQKRTNTLTYALYCNNAANKAEQERIKHKIPEREKKEKETLFFKKNGRRRRRRRRRKTQNYFALIRLDHFALHTKHVVACVSDRER